MAGRAAFAGWLAVVCALGAAYASVILGTSPVLAQVAGGLAVAASVTLGWHLGYRRAWRRLILAALAGAVVLTGWAEVAWFATFFVPMPGGSGGFLAVLAPLFIAVFAGAVSVAGLMAVLGTGALAGLACRDRSVRRGVAAAGVMIAVAGGSALLISGLGLPAVPEQVTPTVRQVTGTWMGAHGATLTLARDGTFTATGLPAGFGDWQNGTPPGAGSGTWHVGRLEPGADVGVIFDFSRFSQAELLVERDGPSLYLYYDKGDPDEGWSGQYRFARQ